MRKDWKEVGARPPYQVWVCSAEGRYRTAFVVARTKKQAMKLTELTGDGFDHFFSPCEGYTDHWRHNYDKGMWIETRGENEEATGIFRRALTGHERNRILEEHTKQYRTMPIGQLRSLVGQGIVSTGKSSHGTSYTVSVYIFEDEDVIGVTSKVEDETTWGLMVSEIFRERPTEEVDWAKEKVDWARDGF